MMLAAQPLFSFEKERGFFPGTNPVQRHGYKGSTELNTRLLYLFTVRIKGWEQRDTGHCLKDENGTKTSKERDSLKSQSGSRRAGGG